jgi:hypothetical protein
LFDVVFWEKGVKVELVNLDVGITFEWVGIWG